LRSRTERRGTQRAIFLVMYIPWESYLQNVRNIKMRGHPIK
jgi:hypothetical protein